jgi:hypothetical protein
LAGELAPDQARRLVVGKTFSFSCFEGTRGAGSVHSDGSVHGTIQMQGNGPVRRANLPPGTLHVKGEKICASVKGMAFQPCFNLQQTGDSTFRGSLAGFGFAYCDFIRPHRGRRGFVRTAGGERGKPMVLRSTIVE